MPIVRWLGLVVLLVAELLFITLRFDTGKLEGRHEWWAELLNRTPLIPQIAIAVAVAVLLFGGSRLREVLLSVSGELRRPHRAWPFLGAHLLAFAGLLMWTAYVVEGDIGSSRSPGVWVLGWLALSFLTLALWVAAALPPTLWLPLVRRGLLPLATGSAIGLVAWSAGWLTGELWRPLGQWTLRVVYILLKVAGQDTVYEPANFVVGTHTFSVQVTSSCSGFEGIGLIWVFLALYLWFFRDRLRFPAALLLLPVGTAVIWLANSVRIASLVLIGTWFSREVAYGGFHSQAGWLAFNLVALGLVALTQRAGIFAKGGPPLPAARTSSPTAAYLAPFLALIATAMLTRAFSADNSSGAIDLLYPLRLLAVAGALWFYRREYRDLRWSWSASGIVIGALVGIIWLTWAVFFPDPSGSEVSSAIAGMTPIGRYFWLCSRLLGYVVAVPLAEELAFRGYLTRRLISAHFEEVPPGRFSWFAFLGSSVVFGILHPHWFVVGTLAGMFFALALYRRGRLWDAVLAHATANAVIAAYALGTGDWSLWG